MATERWKMLSRTVRLVLVAWLVGVALAGTAVAGLYENGVSAMERRDYAEVDNDLKTALDRPAVLAASPLSNRAAKWLCSPTRKFVCTVDGCAQVPATTTIKLDMASHAYSRCDAKGCDTYPQTRPNTGGIFTHLSPTASTVFKVLNDGSAYVETASLGLSVHLTFGECRPQ